jgi:hypothetical protein
MIAIRGGSLMSDAEGWRKELADLAGYLHAAA